MRILNLEYLGNFYFRMFQTFAINKLTGKAVFITQDGGITDDPDPNIGTKFDRANAFSKEPANDISAVDVCLLASDKGIPKRRIDAMMVGPIEEYRAHIRLLDEGDPCVAMWLEFKSGAPRRHTFLIGGDPLEIQFPLSKLAGRDGLDSGTPDTILTARQKTTGINFKIGSNVTEWQRIEDQFNDSLASPGLRAKMFYHCSI